MGRDTFSLACETVAAQMRLQLDGLDLELIRALPRYKYIVRDQRRDQNQAAQAGGELTIKCLPDTWALYEHRLFKAASQIDMLIVQTHDAVAPIPVLSLEDGHYYTAGAIPRIERKDLTRRNEREQKLIVSMLALGLEAGDKAVAAMSAKSQKRYKTMLNECLKPRPGRARAL
jgi:hypothetical protein